MRNLLYALMMMALAAGVTSCGLKGKVRSPAQIQAAEEKKAHKAARENNDEDASPEPGDVPTPDVGANGQTAPGPKQPRIDTPTGTSAARMSVIYAPSEKDDH
jgi:predicted small lipoprotein YifL